MGDGDDQSLQEHHLNNPSFWNNFDLVKKNLKKLWKEEKKQNKEIDKQIESDKSKKLNEVVLLILGSGESGKSTIAKQFRIINQNNFTDDERMGFKKIIHNNIITSIQTLINGCNSFNYELDEENNQIAETILNIPNAFNLSPETAEMIKRLLEDNSIKKAIERASEIQLIDSAQYYFESLDRISGEDYIPSDQDALRSRQPTTGIVETKFNWDYLEIKLVDVAGQKKS